MPQAESLYTEALKYHKRNDRNAAFPLFAQAAQMGHRHAQFSLGYYYANGISTAQDYEKALYWYEKSANAGCSEAMNNLGNLYENGQGTQVDYKLARLWYERAAAQNHSSSLVNLGRFYERGHGVARDEQKSFEYYLAAAKLGSDEAQNTVGHRYQYGIGVAADQALAFHWYRKSAQNGNKNAQNSLGFLYDRGNGVEQDYIQARHWFQKAAEQQNPWAMRNLGIYYERGFGIQKDLRRALEYYQSAANLGHAGAQNDVGRFYENGIGVAKDISKAIEFYKKAKDQGDSAAAENLKRLQPEPTPPKWKCSHDLLRELDSYIGLTQVKHALRRLSEREELPRCLLFIGNPGTGKSIATKFLREMYLEAKLLDYGNVVQVSPGNISFDQVFDAFGQILCIQDADRLEERDLVELMGFHPMDALIILTCSPGTETRIPNLCWPIQETIQFPDYTQQELLEIFHQMANSYSHLIPPEAYALAERQIIAAERCKNAHFRNAYEVADILEHLLLIYGSQKDYYRFLSSIHDL